MVVKLKQTIGRLRDLRLGQDDRGSTSNVCVMYRILEMDDRMMTYKFCGCSPFKASVDMAPEFQGSQGSQDTENVSGEGMVRGERE